LPVVCGEVRATCSNLLQAFVSGTLESREGWPNCSAHSQWQSVRWRLSPFRYTPGCSESVCPGNIAPSADLTQTVITGHLYRQWASWRHVRGCFDDLLQHRCG